MHASEIAILHYVFPRNKVPSVAFYSVVAHVEAASHFIEEKKVNRKWRGRKQLHHHHFKKDQLAYSSFLGGSFHVLPAILLLLLLFPLTISFLVYLIYLDLFTRATSPLQLILLSTNFFFFFSFLFFSFSSFLSFLFTSSQFFHPSSATALCTSISIIGNLLVHTLCILLTFCSHQCHLATHLRHHPNTLCKITATSSSIMTSCS